jgi:hypothetical protein
MNERTFYSTGEAYDATQCDETIKNGDVLVCDRERVIGLAWTWPMAVTVDAGQLHTARTMGIEHLLTDANISVEQVRAAVAAADTRGWTVRDEWRKV